MKRLFIITAVSDKYHHWCVSGISINDSKHYRLVSDDAGIEGAIHKQYLLYKSAEPVRPLDFVEFDVKQNQPQYFQPENIVINERIPPKFVSRASYRDLKTYLTNHNLLLFNTDRLINVNNWTRDLKIDRSLELIHIKGLIIKHIKFGDTSKLQGYFTYKGNNYSKISITDPIIKSKYFQLPQGSYLINECILLVSLGETYYVDNCCLA